MMNNSEIIDQYKYEIKKFTYFDSKKYKNFIEKIEEKMNDIISFSDSMYHY